MSEGEIFGERPEAPLEGLVLRLRLVKTLYDTQISVTIVTSYATPAPYAKFDDEANLASERPSFLRPLGSLGSLGPGFAQAVRFVRWGRWGLWGLWGPSAWPVGSVGAVGVFWQGPWPPGFLWLIAVGDGKIGRDYAAMGRCTIPVAGDGCDRCLTLRW